MMKQQTVSSAHRVCLGIVAVVAVVLSACASVTAYTPTPQAVAAAAVPPAQELHSDIAGAYVTQLLSASTPEREIVLVLYRDGSARMQTDLRNNEMPLLEIGTWDVTRLPGRSPSALVELTLDRRREGPYAEARRMKLVAGNGQLSSVEQDGAAVMEFRRYNRTPTESIAATEWRLEEIQMMNGRILTPSVPEHYTAHFSADGAFSARADCNRLSGAYADIDSQLLLSPLSSTRELCPPGTLYEIYTDALRASHSYVRKNGEFFVSFGPDSGILRFRPLER